MYVAVVCFHTLISFILSACFIIIMYDGQEQKALKNRARRYLLRCLKLHFCIIRAPVRCLYTQMLKMLKY